MAAAPFRYVVSDMDGTLLSPDHLISDYTRDTLKTLVHQFGVTPILATGRHYADVKIVGENLKKYIWGDGTTIDGAAPPASPSRAPMMYLITSNGAIAHNAVTGELIVSTCMDPATVEALFRDLPADEEEMNTCAYQNEDWVVRIDWPEMCTVHKESGVGFHTVPNPPPRSEAPVPSTSITGLNHGIAVGNYDNVSKVFYLCEDTARLQEYAKQVKDIVAAAGGRPPSLTFSATNCMDVMADGVSKGPGLRTLFDVVLPAREGHEKEVEEAMKASIAFGDGLNDTEMLLVVGKGCVMGNANPKLKERLPELEVILPNSEDGVAKKLRSVFGIPL